MYIVHFISFCTLTSAQFLPNASHQNTGPLFIQFSRPKLWNQCARFGVKWSKVMEDGLVFNAMDGAKKLGITADELGKKYDALKKGEGIIKFGGGFYCGKVDDIYVSWWGEEGG